MKVSPSSLPVKLAFLAGYPALSVLFAVLGLEGLWNPWVIVATSFVLLYTSLVLYKPIHECLPEDSSHQIMFFLFCSMFGSATYATISGGGEWMYAALAWILAGVMGNLVDWVLEKCGVHERASALSSRRVLLFIWFIYILSASVPTSLGLSTTNHIIDLLPIILFGLGLGWFGPEVIPRVIPGSLRALLLLGAHLFLICFLYMLLEMVNPALTYPTVNIGNTLLISYISCYAMLVSRCILEALKPPKTDRE